METRSDQELMMEYLYGELSTEERTKFENELSKNPDLQQELNELQRTRDQIAMTDKELVDPFMFATGGSGSVWMATRIITNGILKPAIGLAATISVVLLLGYFTNTSISTKEGYLSVSFGKSLDQSAVNDQYITKAQFDEVMGKISDTELNFTSRLNGVESSVDMRLTNMSSASNAKDSQTNTQGAEQLTNFASQLQRDNLSFLEQYMAQSNTNQQRLIESMLIDFSEILQEQREEDLRGIQYSLETLNDNQELAAQETNQVLASIINKVNTQNN